MATGKNFPYMPIKLSGGNKPIQVPYSDARIVLICDHEDTVIASGLFTPPAWIRGVKGYFYFSAPSPKTTLVKSISGNGAMIFVGDADMLKSMTASADSGFSFDGSAGLYKYQKLSAEEASFYILGEPAITAHYFGLVPVDGGFVFGGESATAFVDKTASSSGGFSISVEAITKKTVYAASASGGGFLFDGTADTVMHGYEGFIPADSDDAIIDANGEEFITVRSDNNGV